MGKLKEFPAFDWLDAEYECIDLYGLDYLLSFQDDKTSTPRRECADSTIQNIT
jgi:hypothetical protein